ncbi:TadE/TadG family type IV pilus assembly protein [Pontibacillus salicampi]|uniref:TadE/TadG family type IV pilus assembly protein n=1 Tax=Pontibacillus salicampi TaxID=1449801 RepID=A0ABV6LUT3_9BACI
MNIKSTWKKLSKRETGNFTIEASLIFPVLLILTLCLIFFSLVIYQKAMMYYSANTIADRLAFTWDNSKKDWETGEFAADDYTTQDGGDGLYWRITGNNFLHQFGAGNLGLGNSSLANEKIDPGRIGEIPFGAEPEITFENDMLTNKINVTLTAPIHIPEYTKNLFGLEGSMEVTASKVVTEPVEFMRNVDFLLYLGEELKKFSDFITEFRNNR